MKGLPTETDFIVVGAGIAGWRAAIELAHAGRVLILNKKEIPAFKSPDWKSEALWLSDEDDVTLHLQETLSAGDRLCNTAGVKILIEEGTQRIEELISWDAHGANKLVFEIETAHVKSRVLHSKNASTGREILRVLWEKTQSLKNVTFAPRTFVTELRTDEGRIRGVAVLDEKGVPHNIACSAVLLATGGIGQIYRNTTNPEAATADGIALAFRAGAELGDLEFVQFHPTVLYMKKVPRFLLEERLRSEGGVLRNLELDRFMAKYHPLGERAPGALVSRAIVHEMEVCRAKDPFVYLDVTHMHASTVQKSFTRIYETCMAHNIDITEDLVPVRPAAHFGVGGVLTDLDGQTNIAGLYAAGEVAVNGVHGANRMPGNSLLESLVYGTRAGKAMCSAERVSHQHSTRAETTYPNGPVDLAMEELIGQIQDLMWNNVGVVRIRTGMQSAVKALEEMAPKLAYPTAKRSYEAANLHLTASLVARSALAREESRGTHYRIDYPDHDDKKFLKHSVVRNDRVVFV